MKYLFNLNIFIYLVQLYSLMTVGKRDQRNMLA